MSIEQILKKYWGYDSFRPVQKDIIQSVINRKDTLALLPTGGGKSICFQVPALSQEGICIVISPLVALIKDQVENLRKRNINALAIYSGMPYTEIKKTLRNAAFGNYKFLYVSPERLETDLFQEFLPSLKICLLAVDEAHCISQWGYDFRPSYLNIAGIREHLQGVPMIALTASATEKVCEDICEKLKFYNPAVFRQSFERPNLSYYVSWPASKQHTLTEILKSRPGSAIVYCRSRKNTVTLSGLLKMNRIQSDFYHAGLSSEERSRKQEDWIRDKNRVMVCTNAFGMGIDKPDVGLVIHYDMPECIENYYQEAGRAGRDGRKSEAILLAGSMDIAQLQEQANIRYPDTAKIKLVYTSLMNYFQVAAGAGAGSIFDFDLNTFTARFKLNVLEASYAIQALAKQGLIFHNESLFTPATAVFQTDKDTLHEYENLNTEWEPLIKGLLRSYEGIFDYPCPITESQLSFFTGIRTEKIQEGLRKLHQDGIIRYVGKKDMPQITLLKDRMYADDFRIDDLQIRTAKQQFLKRLQDLSLFVKNSKDCRSRMIAAYFGDAGIRKCGICDNCLREQKKIISASVFDDMTQKIKTALTSAALSHDELARHIQPENRNSFDLILQFLLSEGIVISDETGRLKRAKKA